MTRCRRLSPGVCVWLCSNKNPLVLRERRGLLPPVHAGALSLEGRWLEAEAGIRTRGHVVALTVAAQCRLHTGLSLVLRREYAVVNVRPDKLPDTPILLQRAGTCERSR